VKLHVPRPPPQDAQAVHHGVTCDVCHVSPISGLRYKCTVCPDFDMCEKCEAKRMHPADHPVIQLRTERHLPAHLPPFFQGEGSQAPSEDGESQSRCPRRGGRCGGGGRWRRWAAAAAAAAAAVSAASSTSSAESKAEPEAQGCPMFECGGATESAPASAPAKGPQATMVRHVTLGHGSKLEQGQVLVKTWAVQNTGAEAWPATSKLIFLRGDRELLGETEEFSVIPAAAGQTVEVSVPVTTPVKAGNYTAYFQLANSERNVFGPRLWLEVQVTRDEEDERKLALAAASSSSSPPPAAHVDTSGWVDVKVETSPVVKPTTAPVTPVVPAVTLAPTTAAPVTPKLVVAIPVHPAPSAPSAPAPGPAKYAAQLASLSAMGFNNAELNAFLLEKHTGDIQKVTNWLLENMQH